MRVIDNYLLVEYPNEIKSGDSIRSARVEETPTTAPVLYKKQLYYGRQCWLPETKARFDAKKEELTEQLKQMEELSQYLAAVE